MQLLASTPASLRSALSKIADLATMHFQLLALYKLHRTCQGELATVVFDCPCCSTAVELGSGNDSSLVCFYQ